MQFENGFEVDAPVDTTWRTLMDLERVAPAVPGAEVLEKTGDNAYKVGIKVKLGPMTMNYKGDVEIVEREDAAHHAVMRVKAKEARGQGTADATVTMDLSGDNGHAAVTMVTDVKLSGRVASMGRGIVEDVARRMIDTFSTNLQEMLTEKPEEPAAAPPPEAPAPPPPPKPKAQDENVFDAGAMASDMAADRLRDPRVLGGLLLFAVVLIWLFGRRG